MKYFHCLLFVAALTIFSAPIHAQTIVSYDIEDAAVSGFGNWAHEYDGMITITGSDVAESSGGDMAFFDQAIYADGSGTLNDGMFGTSALDTQLFANTANTSPIITVELDGFYFIDDITLFSMNNGNLIPGNIDALDVLINGVSETFVSSPGADNEELLTIGNSSLSNLATNQITFLNFQTNNQTGFEQFFAISEIQINGVAVPEPSLAVAMPLIACFFVQRRRRR